MKFVDQVRVEIKAGDGGDGAVAFRREKYVEKGGPSGGDGGNGGSIIFVVDPQLSTLLDFRYQQQYRARNGQNGMGSDCNGSNSDDLVLRVPVGTVLKDALTGEVIIDLTEPGQRFIAAQGGRGGLGNMNFATSTRQTPRFAQPGTPGEARTLLLELKLLADVGLLGFPNAGKSTFISKVSRARPKIADYPFTTLVPNLGMVQYKDGLSFVMADIPGIIEGASEGAGLGHQFLRHVERCRVLIHLIDLGAEGEGREPLQDFRVLNRELEKHSPELAEKPQVVAANKVDLPYARERLKKLTRALERQGIEVYPISAATGEGMGAVLDAVARVLYAPTHKVKPKTRTEKPKTPALKPKSAAAGAGSKPRTKATAPSKAGAKSSSKSSSKKPAAPKRASAKGSTGGQRRSRPRA